jgi:hypothetical protein
MSRFNLELSYDERSQVIVAIAARLSVLQTTGDWGTAEYIGYLELIKRIVDLAPSPGGDTAVTSSAAAPVDSPQPAPAAKTPDSAGELVITPIKIDQPADGKSMVVHFKIRTANGTRLTKVHCWDAAQFGTILATLNQPTTFLTKTTSKGFVNIVGVRR